ncbi:MAG: Uma2 family endonuclease [Oscillospiraceae bacterium]|jgi:Uma2 family endonuclease|nr:Uma2 family endonuclease [Oscillospiraceae bacterium]
MGNNLAYQEESWDELIDGKVVAMSPRPSVNHHQVSLNIANIFSRYLNGKTCRPFGDGVDLYLTEKDRFIPDGMVVCDPCKIKRNGIYGAPDLVIEVLSPSTARYDRGHKKDAYEAAGVREYWIVEPDSRMIEVYLLTDGKFALDNVYSVYPDYLLEKMTEAEKAAVPTAFHCSLYDDLLILLEDVFSDTF